VIASTTDPRWTLVVALNQALSAKRLHELTCAHLACLGDATRSEEAYGMVSDIIDRVLAHLPGPQAVDLYALLDAAIPGQHTLGGVVPEDGPSHPAFHALTNPKGEARAQAAWLAKLGMGPVSTNEPETIESLTAEFEQWVTDRGYEDEGDATDIRMAATRLDLDDVECAYLDRFVKRWEAAEAGRELPSADCYGGWDHDGAVRT
jgi:hypothetical protein